VGKAKRGIMISLSKQLTLIVLLLFLPLMFDIKGVLYAGPVADFLAAVVSFFVLRQEFRRMWRDAEELHI
jgi:Na+-driven multidrug efflux pump